MKGRKPYQMEFWKYLKGLSPNEIEIKDDNRFVYLESDPQIPGFGSSELDIPELRDDVEQTWKQFKGIVNSPLRIISGIYESGREILAGNSTYKSSLWIKKRLSELPFWKQNMIANEMPFLTIGIITATRDGFILAERRPENSTGQSMLLTYPCGYVRNGEKYLSETVDAQSIGELGFKVLNESCEPEFGEITSLGIVRESNEWVPIYTFMMNLDRTSKEIELTEEVRNIELLPPSPSKLSERISDLYSPISDGDNTDGMLIPNATAMLALYLNEIGGEDDYLNLMDNLYHKSKKRGYDFHFVEHMGDTSLLF